MKDWFSKLNKKQREKTADFLLDISKALILAFGIGMLFPETSKRIDEVGILISVLIAGTMYGAAMRLYKPAKRKEKK